LCGPDRDITNGVGVACDGFDPLLIVADDHMSPNSAIGQLKVLKE
jgi:hypothetical protein